MIQLFELGQIVATPGALRLLERTATPVSAILDRYILGDWGEMSEQDLQANNEALVYGDRILASYRLHTGDKVWVITEGDRSSTCILEPGDY